MLASPQKRRGKSGPDDVEWDTYLGEKIDLLKRRKAAGNLKSATGFLLKAIKENYSNPEFAEANAKKAKAEQGRMLYEAKSTALCRNSE